MPISLSTGPLLEKIHKSHDQHAGKTLLANIRSLTIDAKDDQTDEKVGEEERIDGLHRMERYK